MKKIMILFFLPLPLFAQDCGLKGRVAERIVDCLNTSKSLLKEQTKDSENEDENKNSDWALVTKSGGNEIRLDQFSHKYWRMTPRTELNHFDAIDLCAKYNDEALGLKKMKWILPTSQQIKDSEESLSFIKRGIWTIEEPKGYYGSKSSEAMYIKLSNNEGPKPAGKFKNKNVVICISDKN